MALLNFANTYAEISGYLSTPESTTGDYVKLFFSEDGHIITHGKDFTPTFTPTVRGLVPVSSGKVTEILRGSGTWKSIETSDLPIATSVADAITNKTTSTTILNTQQIIDYVGNSFASNDAMRFKGTISYDSSTDTYKTSTADGVEQTGFPTKCEIGDTYRIASQGTYAGQKCSTGDLLICIKDGTGSSLNAATYWTAIEANINGQVTHKVNGTSFYVYSNSTNTFTIYAPTTGGTGGQVLLSNGDAAPIWANQSSLSVGTASKVSNALSAGAGLSMGGNTYNGSAARTISLSPATVSSLGGVYVDKDNTNKTISVTTAGSIYLTQANIINALGYTPGNSASEKTYSTIIASSATETTAVSTATADPYINLLQLQGGTNTVVGSFQVKGSGKISVSGQTALTISLGVADSSNYGGIKIGYTTSGRNYAVQLSDGKAYVNVPWTTPGLATATADGLVPKFDALGTGSIDADSWVLSKLSNGTYDWFKLPANAFLNTNTWRDIKVNGTQLLGTATSTGSLNFKGSGKTTVSGSSGTITITSTWRPVTIGGTSINDNTLNFIPSGDVYLKTDSTNDGIQDISFGLSWFNISANNGQGAYEYA